MLELSWANGNMGVELNGHKIWKFTAHITYGSFEITGDHVSFLALPQKPKVKINTNIEGVAGWKNMENSSPSKRAFMGNIMNGSLET